MFLSAHYYLDTDIHFGLTKYTGNSLMWVVTPQKEGKVWDPPGLVRLSGLWLESLIKLTLFILIQAKSNDFSTVSSHFPQVPHRSQDEKRDKRHYKVK